MDDDDFLFKVGNMTQHEEEESMCQRSLKLEGGAQSTAH